jgi:GNAT superfamily N-acetyltransferase
MTLKIRPAIIPEAIIVQAIIQASFAEYEGVVPVPTSAGSETVAEAEADIAEGRVFLAMADEEAVGTVRYRLYPDYLYVGRLAVLPDYRGKGAGLALMQFLERLALTLERNSLKLGTRGSMPGNLAFYQKLGYEIAKTEPHPKGPDTIVWFVKQLLT